METPEDLQLGQLRAIVDFAVGTLKEAKGFAAGAGMRDRADLLGSLIEQSSRVCGGKLQETATAEPQAVVELPAIATESAAEPHPVLGPIGAVRLAGLADANRVRRNKRPGRTAAPGRAGRRAGSAVPPRNTEMAVDPSPNSIAGAGEAQPASERI